MTVQQMKPIKGKVRKGVPVKGVNKKQAGRSPKKKPTRKG